jgi:hypothetical protein
MGKALAGRLVGRYLNRITAIMGFGLISYGEIL